MTQTRLRFFKCAGISNRFNICTREKIPNNPAIFYGLFLGHYFSAPLAQTNAMSIAMAFYNELVALQLQAKESRFDFLRPKPFAKFLGGNFIFNATPG